jgi:alkanesulfonate monooxygenase SsuD/methylene tetrahydromethanopterin reductase-like flavin-dependent oxidoreductase (luciferase family)
MADMVFGIILPNRGVNLGICTSADLLKLADMTEASPHMDSVWVGDALFVKRRLDAMILLAAVAGRTERVLLGPACMGSFALRDPLVLAYEWASLDRLSNGRTRMVACSGGGAGPAWEAESAAMGIDPADRHKRMVDHILVLRHLWTTDDAPYESRFHKFAGVTLEPKPVQDPCPIWLATNLGRQARGTAQMGGSDFALRRVGQIADGWMTHSVTPEGFGKSWDMILGAAAAAGRATRAFDHVLYHHINVNDDRDAALADSKKFLDLYYGANYTKERLEAWLTYGTPKDCIAHLRTFRDCGVRRVAVRVSTMGDAHAQLRRVVEEVLPFVNERH